jgi:hypothetical protein
MDDMVIKTRKPSTAYASSGGSSTRRRSPPLQGKLLGFIISHRGIEENSEKITAITDMDAPRMIMDV